MLFKKAEKFIFHLRQKSIQELSRDLKMLTN